MDPTPQTLATTYTTTPVPRKMPVPEGPPGPPPIDFSIVGAPVLNQARAILDPLQAQISALIRGAIDGTPEAIRTIAEAAPAPADVLRATSGLLAGTGLVAGVSGAAAKLLAGPTAGIPYVGAGVLGWAALADPVAAALGASSAGFQALATGVQVAPTFLSQWGQLLPQTPATAISPPPVAV